MPDLTLEQRVAAELRAVGDDLDPVPVERLDRLVEQRAGRLRRRDRQRRSLAVATAAAVLATAVVLATGPWPSTRDEPVAMTTAGDHDVLFLAPERVPEGWELLHAEGGDRRGEPGPTVTVNQLDRFQRWVRFVDGQVAAVVDIRWGRPHGARVMVDPTGSEDPSQPVTVRGHDGTRSGSGAVLSWRERPDLVVSITGTTARPADPDRLPEALKPSLLAGIAADLVVGDGGRVDLPTPPAGFELVGEMPSEVAGLDPRQAIYGTDDGRQVRIDVVDGNQRPPAMNLVGEGAVRAEVRGHEAVQSPAIDAAPVFWPGAHDGERWYLTWEEVPGTLVTLSGIGLSETELLAFAQGLEPVDVTAWFAP